MCSTAVDQGNFCPKCGYQFPQAQNAPYPASGQQAPSSNPPVPYQQQMPNQPGPERNWAIASVALGIASFVVLPIIFTPVGVIFGAVSLTKKSHGNNLAIAGIVLSLLGFLASIVINGILLS
jgi:hypothetical protein